LIHHVVLVVVDGEATVNAEGFDDWFSEEVKKRQEKVQVSLRVLRHQRLPRQYGQHSR
jgi:hypothetical protein